jgi:hypothetical protein
MFCVIIFASNCSSVLVPSHASRPGDAHGEATEPAHASEREAKATEARNLVVQAVDALKRTDESAFRGLLSDAQRAKYTREYFDLWVSEVLSTRRARAGEVRFGPAGQTAQVDYSFLLHGQQHRVWIRLVREGLVWRWNEN